MHFRKMHFSKICKILPILLILLTLTLFESRSGRTAGLPGVEAAQAQVVPDLRIHDPVLQESAVEAKRNLARR